MKKKLKAAAMVIFTIFFAGMFTGCLTYLLSGGEVNLIGDAIYVAEAIESGIESTKERKEGTNPSMNYSTHEPLPEGGKRAINQYYSYKSMQEPPFDNKPEERLTRRISTLTVGTPVDVSQYIVHSDSFAVIGNEIAYNRLLIDFIGFKNPKFNILYEFDITVSYEINSQNYKEEITVVTISEPSMNDFIEKYIARKHNVSTKDIKKFNVKKQKPRSKGKNEYFFQGIMVREMEKCYYQFDVEVEYQKTNSKNPDASHYETFNKIYRSDFTSIAAAALDVQMTIWLETRVNGYKDTPLPIINFVRVEKYPL